MYMGLYDQHGNIFAYTVNVGFEDGEDYILFEDLKHNHFGLDRDYGTRGNFQRIKKLLEEKGCTIKLLPDIVEGAG